MSNNISRGQGGASMANVTVYVKEGCPYCARLINDLKDEKVDYTEINITYDRDALKKIKKEYQADKVPVLVKGDEVTVGYKSGLG